MVVPEASDRISQGFVKDVPRYYNFNPAQIHLNRRIILSSFDKLLRIINKEQCYTLINRYNSILDYTHPKLYCLLKDEKDVHFTFGTYRGDGIDKAGQGMASSKFCLNIAGDTPSSNRLFDAIASQCVPVIISDGIELPFEDVLDYSEFGIFVQTSDAVKKGYLLYLLRGIKKDQWTKLWERLKEIAPQFEYRYPSQPGDAVDMVWEAVLRKKSSVQFRHHRKNRYTRSEALLKRI
eukprot:XP_024441015.1 probable arabinosyltransferase ARAD2 [Populus trichocarpa]